VQSQTRRLCVPAADYHRIKKSQCTFCDVIPQDEGKSRIHNRFPHGFGRLKMIVVQRTPGTILLPVPWARTPEAGMSAGVDLALALLADDLGADLARVVAKILVVYHRRAGGQSQFSTLLDLDAESDRIQTALAYAKEHLSAPLSVQALARVAFLSLRQFSRLFREETGQSPAKAIERLRVESARLMMEAGRFSAEEIARKNGFGNRERMRRSFLRAFGQPPQTIQRTVNALIQ
jgi:AraC-like DNA-binding protein